MNNFPTYVNEENAHERIIEELRAAGFLSAVWMIEDLLRNHGNKLEEKDDEVSGWEEECSAKERKVGSYYSDLEGVQHDLSVMENARDDLQAKLDAALEKIRFWEGS